MVCFSFINMDIQQVSYLCKCVSIVIIQFVYIKISLCLSVLHVYFSLINMYIQEVSYICKCISIANIQFVFTKISLCL